MPISFQLFWLLITSLWFSIALFRTFVQCCLPIVKNGTCSSLVLISPVVSCFYTNGWRLANKRSAKKNHISFFLQHPFPVSTKILDFLFICLFFFSSLQHHYYHLIHKGIKTMAFWRRRGKKEDLILSKKKIKKKLSFKSFH